MNAQELTVAVEQAVRTDAARRLLKPKWADEHKKSSTPPTTGFCYVASEMAFHLLGGSDAGYRPHRAGYTEDGEEKDHWWLVGPDGIVDVTASQFTAIGKLPPYDLGKPRGFLTKQPSKRAQQLLEIVKQFLSAPKPKQEPVVSEGTRINRVEFLESLHRVSPGLSKKGNVEQSSCFVFKDGWVCTFNDEITCRTRVQISPDATGAVRAARLIDTLDAMTDDTIDVRLTGSSFHIRTASGADEVNLKMESEVVLPVDSVAPPGQWAKLPEDFSLAVKQAVGAAGANTEEFLATCVHVHPDFLEATDRKQFVRYNLKTGATRSFQIKAETLIHVASLDLTYMGETDNWVHFKSKGERKLIFSCRRHLEDYQQWSEKIGEFLQCRGTPTTLPQGIDLGTKLCSVLTRDDAETNKVTVNLTPGRMTIHGEGIGGWAKKHMETSYSGDPVSFRIAPATLIQIVTEHNECEIGDYKLRVSGERWTYMTALGKVDSSNGKQE